ncbi:MAG: hypothetical protein KGI80_01475 [Verrucomicrobiota bacterium]|nr:hypothetical protein [Verrucomicrobiota bacterium]
MISFLVSFSLFANLETLMTPEEQLATGIYKLNARQKEALETWVSTHYAAQVVEESSPPQITSASEGTQEMPHLSENLLDSRFLKLSDNTLWNVRPEDVPIAQGWITPAEIKITPSDDPTYPSRLTNMISGSSILARQVQQLPSQPPQTSVPSPTAPVPQQYP